MDRLVTQLKGEISSERLLLWRKMGWLGGQKDVKKSEREVQLDSFCVVDKQNGGFSCPVVVRHVDEPANRPHTRVCELS